MNKVILFGHLGKDPEIRYTANGNAMCKFSLATQNFKKETAWHRCVAFGKTAELIEKYVKKGDKLLISDAEISYGSYEKDGQTVYTTDIIVNRFEFAGGGQKSSQNEMAIPYGNNYEYPGDKDEDVPF